MSETVYDNFVDSKQLIRMKLVPVSQSSEWDDSTSRCLSLIEKTIRQLLEHPELPDMYAYLDTVSSLSLGRLARNKDGPQRMELLFAISYLRKPSFEQFQDRLRELLVLMNSDEAYTGSFNDPQTRNLHFTFNEFTPALPSGGALHHPRNSAIIVSESSNYLLIELRFNNARLRAVG